MKRLAALVVAFLLVGCNDDPPLAVRTVTTDSVKYFPEVNRFKYYEPAHISFLYHGESVYSFKTGSCRLVGDYSKETITLEKLIYEDGVKYRLPANKSKFIVPDAKTEFLAKYCY